MKLVLVHLILVQTADALS